MRNTPYDIPLGTEQVDGLPMKHVAHLRFPPLGVLQLSIYPVFDVISHRLGVTAQKYPVHVVIKIFFGQSQFFLDNMKEEVKGFFPLHGRFSAKKTQQIGGSHVC